MSAWDPFANLRPEQPQPDEDHEEESVGGRAVGGADGGAGGERFPQEPTMNDLLRDLIRGGNA
jgi:hypothetical protein